MSETKVYKKLFDAMNEMEPVIKDATGSTGNRAYKYAQLSQVLGVIKPCLAKHGLLLGQTPKLKDNADGEPVWVLTTSVVDVDTGESLIRDERVLIRYDKEQAQGSHETYMRRYALLNAFNLAPEDDDGKASNDTNKPTQRKRPSRVTAKTADKIAEPTKKAMGDVCIQYAQVFGLNPEAFKQSVWQELKDKPEGEWLKKISYLRAEITASGNE